MPRQDKNDGHISTMQVQYSLLSGVMHTDLLMASPIQYAPYNPALQQIKGIKHHIVIDRAKDA